MLSCRISTCRRCPLKYQPNRLLLSTLIGSTDLGGFFKCKKCYNKAKMFLQWWDMEIPARVFSLIISELHFARSRVALFNTEASHASVMTGLQPARAEHKIWPWEDYLERWMAPWFSAYSAGLKQWLEPIFWSWCSDYTDNISANGCMLISLLTQRNYLT